MSDNNEYDSWRDFLKLEDKYQMRPENLVEDLLPQFKRHENPLRPLALGLEQVAKGESSDIATIYNPMRHLLENFRDQAYAHDWPALAFGFGRQELDARSLDFLAGAYYIHG